MRCLTVVILISLIYTISYSQEHPNSLANQNNDLNNLNYGIAPLFKMVNLSATENIPKIKASNIPLHLPFKYKYKINQHTNNYEITQSSQSDLKILLSFEGIHYGFNGIYPNFYTPPDVQIAVSNNHVVEFVNVLGAVWSKSGNFLGYISLNSLFSGNYIGDPRIIFDPLSNRFFASVFDKDYNAIRVAVSITDNPLGSWYVYIFYQPNGLFPDQPYIGVNDDKVVVSANIYHPTLEIYYGAQYWIINKSQMLSGLSVNYAVSDLDTTVASIRPAHHLSSSNIFYMATTQTISNNLIYVYSIIGTPPSSVIVNKYNFNVKTINSPPIAPQAGSPSYLDTIDIRIQDIIWKNNRLLFTANVGCTPAGDFTTRSCLRIIEINTSNFSIKQDFDYGIAGKYLFFGSLRLNKDNIMFIIFGYSSPTNYPGLMVTYQTIPNNLENPIILKNGLGPETVYCSNNVCRYGDYFGSAVDPLEPEYVWVAGEFGRGSSGWSTYIAKLGLTEYFIVASYSIIGNETGSSPPILRYYYNNSLHSVTLTKNPVKYKVDKNSPWEVTEILIGSNENERWKTNQVTKGIVNSPLTINLTYYHQYYVQFKYEIINGGSGYLPPKITIYQFGKKIILNPDTYIWADENIYNFTNPLIGSNENERWYSLNSEGKIDKAGIYKASYYHQYLITFNYKIIGKLNNNAPEVSFTQFGETKKSKFNTTVWIDTNTKYNFTNPLIGSNENERWYTNNETNGIAEKPKIILVIYYHQFSVNFTYKVIGGGEYKEPMINFIQFGKNVDGKPNYLVWVDSNTKFIYQNPLPNSNENERWYSLNNEGVVEKPGEVLIIYYHQYYVQFKYEIINGGSGYLPPKITIYQFGKKIILNPDTYIWADENIYNFTNPLIGSNENERWYSLNSEGKIDKAGIYKASYYHQYLINIKYSVIGKDLPKYPILYGVSSGKNISKEILREFVQIWLDSNTEFYVTNIIQERLNERWIALNFRYFVTKPENIVIDYQHQYYVNITVNFKGAGNVYPLSGWYNAGSTLLISVYPNNGWKFYKWIGFGNGSYTGFERNASIIVNSPIEETAILLVSLKIYSTSGGIVKYSYENETGEVKENAMKEIFVLPGTEIKLTAEPASIFFVFKDWNLGLKETQIKIIVDKPTEIMANFDLNYFLIIIILLAVAIFIAIILIIRRKISL